jgi:hypothetical protein
MTCGILDALARVGLKFPEELLGWKLGLGLLPGGVKPRRLGAKRALRVKEQIAMKPIDKFSAWELCAEIWKENRKKWYTPAGFHCWNCWRFSKATPADRIVSRQEDYRGCELVNQRYDRQRA